MAEVEWLPVTSIRFVEEYKKRPELWNPRHDLYRVLTAKHEAWSDMAETFQCDIADLRKKMNSIFASYRREKSKIRAGARSTWFMYSHLSFLPNHLENNVAGQQEVEEQESEDSSDSDDAEPAPTFTVKTEPGASRKRHTIATPANKRPKIMRPLLKRKLVTKETQKEINNQLDSRLVETLRLLRKSALTKKKDECDTFGEYIAMSLRKHDERSQSMIKQAINNILFEQEMKKYSNHQYSVVLTENDENPLVLTDNS